MCDKSRAERINAFDGTQPVFRQSPPIRCFSTSVTLARTVAAIKAVTRPAEPAPMTTRLRSKRFGFVHLAYTLRARTASLSLRAASGNRPSSTSEPSTPGDTMPFSDVMFASCVPAFTYTSVAANMPSWLTQ